jgi:CheY-like chemotaxis protein
MTNDSRPAVVLVADDEPSMLSLIAQHVKTLGHRVHLAHDGGEAWSQAREHKPDLVLLDVMMPVMSGWEVCRMVREEPSLSHTAVIMITGIGERLNELTSPLFGADHYLDKPFELADLDHAIASVLKKHGISPPPTAPHVNGVQDRHASMTASHDDAKPAAKKPAAKKSAPKKPAAKKSAPKKPAAKKSAPKKPAAKKPASPKKPAPKKKPVAKKAATKKAPAKKAVAKKPATKKATTKKKK